MTAGEFGSPIGPLLRESLPRLSWLEKVHWFAADRSSVLERLRADHSAEEPDPTLVVWDRYVCSAFAYRLAEIRRAHADEEAGLAVVRAANIAFPAPSLTIYLDLPLQLSRARSPSEHQSIEVLALVRAAYEEMLDELSEVARVDATQAPQQVAEDTLDAIINSGILNR